MEPYQRACSLGGGNGGLGSGTAESRRDGSLYFVNKNTPTHTKPAAVHLRLSTASRR